MKTPRLSLLASAALLLGFPLFGFGQTTWDFGGTPDKNWSTLTNWSTDASPAATAVVFGATGVTASATTVGNIVDSSYTSTNSLTSLTYNGNSTNWQVTQIASGQTLTDAGAFLVGGLSGASQVTKAAFTGTGSLVINNSGSAMTVSNTGATSALATLDMSALSTFTATVSSFNVGTGTTGFGTAYLADSSTITAGTLSTGGSGASYGAGVSNKLYFGTTTTLNVDALAFAKDRTYGTIKFRATGDGAANNTTVSGATLTIRGSTGGSSRATTMTLGDSSGTMPGTAGGTSTLNLTGGSVDALVGTLTVGNSSAGLTSPNNLTATMSMAAGTFDATTVIVGQTAGTTTGTGTLTGNLNVSGGTFTAGTMTLANNTGTGNNRAALGNLAVSGTTTAVNVTGNLVMGNRTAATVTPTVTVSGGTLTVGGNLAEGTGTGSSIASTVNLSGGTLDMTHGTITVDTFAFTAGTLKNVAAFTAATSGGLNVQSASTLAYDLDSSFTTLSLTGTFTLGGSSNLSLALANGYTPSASYTLVTNDTALDSIVGSFATINGGAFGLGNTFTLSNNTGSYLGTLNYTGGDGNDLSLALVAIPEPSACAALAGVLALGAVVWRRGRGRSA